MGEQILGTTGTLLAAGLEASALTAKAVTAFLREVFKPEPPPKIVVNVRRPKEVEAFFRNHTPMPYWRAQWKAFCKGVKEPGNLHERMARVENYLRQYRTYERIRKDATVVVKNYDAAPLEVREAFSKLKERDGFILVPEERRERKDERAHGATNEQHQGRSSSRQQASSQTRNRRPNSSDRSDSKHKDRYEH